MIDRIKKISLGDREIPYICTINVLEKIQEQYGTVSAWNGKLFIKINKEKSEFNIKVLKETLLWMINEGYACMENEERMTNEKLGILLSHAKITNTNLYEMVVEAFADSLSRGNGQTTESQTKIVEP